MAVPITQQYSRTGSDAPSQTSSSSSNHHFIDEMPHRTTLTTTTTISITHHNRQRRLASSIASTRRSPKRDLISQGRRTITMPSFVTLTAVFVLVVSTSIIGNTAAFILPPSSSHTRTGGAKSTTTASAASTVLSSSVSSTSSLPHCTTPPSSITTMETKSPNLLSPLKSFLPTHQSFHSLHTISSSANNEKIVTSCQSRYGGRANHHPIIVNPPTSSSLSSSSPPGRKEGVLGFDLKMVSSSTEESQMENNTPMNKSTTTTTNNNNSNKKAKKQIRKQLQNQQDYRGSIGIDTLNQQNASPIKKQIVSNLLQSYNEFGQMKEWRNQHNQQRKAKMNPFHFDRDDFTTTTKATTASTTSKQTSTLSGDKRQTGHFNEEQITKSESSSTSSISTPSNVPMWFPYIPNRQQIDSLKIIELKDACSERGLIKSGNKQELQQRLFEWTLGQHKRRVLERNARRSTTSQPLHDVIDQSIQPPNESFDSFLSSSFDSFSAASAAAAAAAASTPSSSERKQKSKFSKSTIDEEDIDNIDNNIEPLINRRKELLRSKQFSFSKNKKGILGFEIDDKNEDGVKRDNYDNEDDEDDEEEYFDDVDEYMSSSLPTADYLSDLTKTFHESKSVSSSHDSNDDVEIDALNNYQLKELYLQAKHADQKGDSDTARTILQRLLLVTPKDSRIIRRLARLDIQENNLHRGREILQTGLQQSPNDVYLLQGLGQLERNCGNLMKARDYFKQAIQSSPDVPNPYHALGTLEHSQGNIRAATTVLRMGLKHCPSNHRLHHALGDLYREAKMLNMAEKAYLKGLKCLDLDSERTGRQMDWSRSFFYSAMSYLSYDLGDKGGCRHWLQKSVDIDRNKLHSQGWIGLAQLEESEGNIETARDVYHKALNVYEKHRGIRKLKTSSRSMLGNFRGNNRSMKPSKLGDRWLSVYESLARFEEEHGGYHSANNVYSRAATAFPRNWNILISWARLQIKHKKYDRARTLLELSCIRAGKSDSEPVRIFAEFEMSVNNFSRARSILFNGAQSCSESSDGSLHNSNLSRLYHTWAVCEWHMGNLDRTEVLFDHSLRVTDAGAEGSEMRALILLSIARFLFHARGDLSLAQHCVSLSLAEDAKLLFSWILWSRIAEKMGNESLAKSCREEASKIQGAQNDALTTVKNGAISQMLRRAPWHHKIFNLKEHKSWYERSSFPDDSSIAEARENFSSRMDNTNPSFHTV